MHGARAARARGFDSLPSLSDVGTVSFRWILPFWYFCCLLADKARLALSATRKQKYQNGNIHRKLKVPTSEREGKLSNPRARAARAPCREKFFENLRKPARPRRVRAMHWFSADHRYSTHAYTHLLQYTKSSTAVYTAVCTNRCRPLNLVTSNMTMVRYSQNSSKVWTRVLFVWY